MLSMQKLGLSLVLIPVAALLGISQLPTGGGANGLFSSVEAFKLATSQKAETSGVTAAAIAATTPYAVPSYLSDSTDYPELRVNGQIVPVARGEGGSSNGITYDFARVAVPEGANVILRARQTITSYAIHPGGFGISGQVSGNTLTFSVDRPRYLLIDVNGLRRLALLIDPPETKPDTSDSMVRDITKVASVDKTGGSLATQAIQSAIDGLPTGATLYFPPGEYRFTQLQLKSNMTLYLAGGAILRGSIDPADYSWFRLPGGTTDLGWGHIQMWDVSNVKIKGHGLIDGRQTRYATQKGPYRQALIQIIRSANVEIEGVTVMNAGFWNVTPRYSHDVSIRRLKVLGINRWLWADGIDAVSSRNVEIADSFVISGDDGFSPKGQGNFRDVINPKPETQLTNVIYRDSVVWSGNANGIRVSGELFDNINNLTFSNIEIVGARGRGIFVSAHKGDKTISEILFENVTVYDSGPTAVELEISDVDGNGTAGTIRDVTFDNVRMVPKDREWRFSGFTGANPIRNIAFRNLTLGSQLIGSRTELDSANGAQQVIVTNTSGPSFQETALAGPRYQAEAFNPASPAVVDVKNGDGGTVVGAYGAGDALVFDSVDFAAGADTLRLRLASGSSNDVDFQVRLGGPNGRVIATGDNALKTGAWSTYQTIDIPIERLAGRRKITLVNAGTGGLDVNWFELRAVTGPRRYEAEDRDATGGAVDVISADGGTAIGAFDYGDTLTFNAVDFGTQTSSLTLRVATGSSLPIDFTIRSGGPNGAVIGQLGSGDIPNNGWSNYSTIVVPITPQSGTKQITLRNANGGVRVNWFEVP